MPTTRAATPAPGPLSSGPLSIGFVGSGFNARFHIQALVGVRDSIAGGIASPREETARSAAELAHELGVGDPRVFPDAEAMAADPSIDAIWICAPNDVRVLVMEQIVRGNARRAHPLLGIACEKPLARTLSEALRMLELSRECGVPTGYLEDEVFMPGVTRGKEIVWRRAVPIAGRPYLARATEEHSGPHKPWFWQGRKQGGGVLNDMMCHAVETARFLLTAPGAPRDSLRALSVSAQIASLKWTRPEYVERLKREMGPEVDYASEPSEDYASATIQYEDRQGRRLMAEVTTSWSYVGPGLRHTIELLGPEYSMHYNTIDTGLSVFFSRRVTGQAGEDLVEKQNAEQGLMPVVPDEVAHYGYVGEDRHYVQCFRTRVKPLLTFADGVDVVRLLMACYLSAETGAMVDPSSPQVAEFEPAVSRGAWQP